MNLYIVRHAEAAAKEIHPERKLTEAGVRDAESLGKLMASLQLGASEIWHSPKPRAAQTAHAIADAVGLGSACLVREGLLPGDPVKPLAKILNLIEQDLIIVGHDPFLTRLASRLVCGRASAAVVDLDKPSLLHLTNVPEGEWRIVQLLSPARLKGILAEVPKPAAANP
jgi:phosphohistidine phosphatase